MAVAIKIRVKLNKSGINNIFHIINNNVSLKTQILRAWAVIYRTFSHARYLSKAVGGWPKPRDESLWKRYKNRYGFGATLIDTVEQLDVLSPIFSGAPGAVEDVDLKNFRIIVGYGGDAQKERPGTPVSIARVAAFHNFGEGRNPKRQILARAPKGVTQQMADEATAIIKQRPTIVVPPPP